VTTLVNFCVRFSDTNVINSEILQPPLHQTDPPPASAPTTTCVDLRLYNLPLLKGGDALVGRRSQEKQPPMLRLWGMAMRPYPSVPVRSSERKNNIPVVFISSTVEDLRPYRAAARDAAISSGFLPVMCEHWSAKERHPFAECLAKVAKAHVLVVIVAYRYGWVPEPPDQPANQFKSMTWLECEQARRSGIDVLAFLVDEGAQWPDHLREEHRVMAAYRSGNATDQLLKEIRRDEDSLAQFKEWLRKGRIRATFKNKDEFQGKLGRALDDWRKERPDFEPPSEEELAARGDPEHYLKKLREATGWINLRGLQVASEEARRFPIEQLYITLTTASGVGESQTAMAPTKAREASDEALPRGRERIALEEALRCPRFRRDQGAPGVGPGGAASKPAGGVGELV